MRQAWYEPYVRWMSIARLLLYQLTAARFLGMVALLVVAIPANAYASGEQLLYFSMGLTGLYQIFFLGALLQSKKLKGSRVVASMIYLVFVTLSWIFLFSELGEEARHGMSYAVLVWGGPLLVFLVIYMTLGKKSRSAELPSPPSHR